jgi:lysophospholipase L1-like esterase
MSRQIEASRVHIYLAGDSTVQPHRPEIPHQAGWGHSIARLLVDEVEVFNQAIGGRSSRTFVEEGRLDEILTRLDSGDYLFIQMGHNDASAGKPERYTEPYSEFKGYLRQYIDGARQKRATPILITPVATLHYENGQFLNDFPDYCESMKQLAAEENVLCIDLMQRSLQYFASIGYEEAKRLFMVTINGTDHVHFTFEGAERMAELVAQGIRELGDEQLSQLAR